MLHGPTNVKFGLFGLWLKRNESVFPPSASRFPEKRVFTSRFIGFPACRSGNVGMKLILVFSIEGTILVEETEVTQCHLVRHRIHMSSVGCDEFIWKARIVRAAHRTVR